MDQSWFVRGDGDQAKPITFLWVLQVWLRPKGAKALNPKLQTLNPKPEHSFDFSGDGLGNPTSKQRNSGKGYLEVCGTYQPITILDTHLQASSVP